MSQVSQEGECNLLFGILALQMDFVTREQLIAATSVWVKDKSRALAAILVEQGSLEPSVLDLLQALVAKHLDQHDNDSQASLAALTPLGSAREELDAVGDDQVSRTLSMVGAGNRNELDATLPWTAGDATSVGQRFRVLRFHKKGGLGEVFVAYDRELNREVALKEIQRRHADSPDSRARFTLEAEVTGRLEHPGIVPVYGLGHYDDGRPFYAMRFIRGENLNAATANFHQRAASRSAGENSLEFRELLGRFLDVCHAIEYAHSRGVLHRDIKPGNIMLGKYGETLMVDWGLARAGGRDAQHQDTADETTLIPRLSDSSSVQTALGQALGTPAFMSPEQAAGRWDELGPATDVYGLGATLYVLLTGQAAFRGDRETVLAAVRRGEFPPPRRVRPPVPRALEAICLKAMALEPGRRYASALELAVEVERWLADEPVRAFREPWLNRARRWMRRHRLAVATVTALLTTSFVALAVGYVLVRKQRDLAQQNAAMTRQVIEHFLIRIGDDRWSQVPQFEPVRVEMVDQAVALYRQLLEQSPHDVSLRFDAASSLRRSANLYRMVNRFDRAQPLYRESASLLEDVRRERPGDQAMATKWVELLGDEADATLRAEGPAAAEAKCREAYEVASQTRKDFPDSVAARLGEARAQLSFAETLQQMGRYAEAIPAAQAAAAICSEVSDGEPDNLAVRASTVIAWNNLANMTRDAGQLELAAAAQKEAVERGRANVRSTPAEPNLRFTLAAALVEQGRLYRAQGDRGDQALDSLNEACGILETLTAEFPSAASFGRRLADALTVRGELYLEIGRLPAAGADAARAVEIAERLEQQAGGAAGYHWLVAFAYTLVGKAELMQGNSLAARASLVTAQTRIAMARKVNPDGPRLIEKAAEVESLLEQVRTTKTTF